MATAAGPLLDRQALNRALLARQHLLARAPLTVERMVTHLVGLQSQAPDPPHLGLWTRLSAVSSRETDELLEQRRLVRLTLLRGTVHLVTAEDALAIRPLIQPILDRALPAPGDGLAGHAPSAIAARARAVLVEHGGLTVAALGPKLAAAFPDADQGALTRVVRMALPCVQLPPRGQWRRPGPPALMPLTDWLGPADPAGPPRITEPADDQARLDALALRYLAAFGPATAADAAHWSGLPAMRPAIRRLADRLIGFRDDRGRMLVDLPDAPRPEPDATAPIRLLPAFDNLLLSHDDRTRILGDYPVSTVITVNGLVAATVLVDGFVQGTWTSAVTRTAEALTVRLLAPVAARTRRAIEDEALRLLALASPGAAHEVRFADPP